MKKKSINQIYADLIISRYEHMTKIKPERINK